MTPQEIADCKDNVGVSYDDISSVTVKNKGAPEILFVFSRMQKLGWEKMSFLFNARTISFKEVLHSAVLLLRRFLQSKLDNQLQDKKFFPARTYFEN
jgi:hypothetical protein